ncbi:MAG: response regulator [Candidatus Omnitrophica bacterium]|nr:response regulator [Candidatus Omnitrophota bacterium]
MENTSQIFVVDDDVSVGKSLSRLISSVGLEARVFTSPTEFLDNVTPETRGCLVLDIRMPQLSGYDVQKYLSDEGSQLKTIFISAHEDEEPLNGNKPEGVVAFLQKPFKDQDLFNAIALALGKENLS